MKHYHTLLLDVDGTLLDFDQSEQKSIQEILEHYGIAPEKELLTSYHTLNQRYWREFECGTIRKDQIMGFRFTEYFQSMGMDIDGNEAEALHRDHLNNSAILIDGAEELCSRLSRSYNLYVVTNGVSHTQYRRLSKSGLDKYFRGIFVSEDAGAQKPQKEFFQYCFRAMNNWDASGMLIMGDSLTSDIKGGNLSGIPTCWYNPLGLPREIEVTVNYEIRKLRDLEKILL